MAGYEATAQVVEAGLLGIVSIHTLELVGRNRKTLAVINNNGLDAFTPVKNMGHLAELRKHEVLGAINRLRGIKWRG